MCDVWKVFCCFCDVFSGSFLELREEQESIRHQWSVNQDVLDALMELDSVLQGVATGSSGNRKVDSFLGSVMERVRGRQEELLMLVLSSDWGLIRSARRDKLMECLSADKR